MLSVLSVPLRETDSQRGSGIYAVSGDEVLPSIFLTGTA